MIKLQCSKCGKIRMLDDEDDDEVHNACLEGWEFAFKWDVQILCPACKNNDELKEFSGEF